MILKLVYFWKILHFVIYSFIRFCQRAVNRVFFSYNKIGFVKKLWARRGVHGEDEIKRRLNYETTNAKWSPVVLQAGIHMGGILVILQVSLAFFIIGFLGKAAINSFFENKYLFLLFFLVFAGIINYALLFKNDKYLDDFAEFDKLPKRVLLKYKLLSFLFICGVIGLFITSSVWGLGR